MGGGVVVAQDSFRLIYVTVAVGGGAVAPRGRGKCDFYLRLVQSHHT